MIQFHQCARLAVLFGPELFPKQFLIRDALLSEVRNDFVGVLTTEGHNGLHATLVEKHSAGGNPSPTAKLQDFHEYPRANPLKVNLSA